MFALLPEEDKCGTRATKSRTVFTMKTTKVIVAMKDHCLYEECSTINFDHIREERRVPTMVLKISTQEEEEKKQQIKNNKMPKSTTARIKTHST